MALKINNTNYAPIVLDLSTKELIDGTITSIETDAPIISPYAFFNCTELVSVVAANATSVGENAFYGCSKLETVDLRNCVTIGNNAFNGCYNLKTIIVSDKLTNCASNLLGNTFSRKVIFITDDPAKWTQINFTKTICSNSYSLYYKSSIFPNLNETLVTSFTLSSDMSTINTYSVKNLGLTGFSARYNNQIPAGALGLGNNINKLYLSDNGLDCIGKYFDASATYQTQNNYGAVRNVTFLQMCSDVKPRFCYGLTNLARVELTFGNYWASGTDSTETIGQEAFMGCTGLSMLTLPNTLHTIGNDAFKDCFTNATSGVSGSMSTEIFNNSIYWDKAIVYIGSQYSTSTTYGWGKIAFGNEYSNPAYAAKTSNNAPSTIRVYATTNDYMNGGEYGFFRYSYFTEYVSSNNTVTANIDDYAFYGQSNLTTVDLSSGNITSIGTYAFAYSGVSTLTIGSNIDRIPSYCFLACPITSSITIGSNITEVEPYAFGTGGVSNLPYIASITIDDAFLNPKTNKIWYNSFSRANVTSVTTPDILALKTYTDNGGGSYSTTGNRLFGYDNNLNTNDFKNVHSIYITTSSVYRINAKLSGMIFESDTMVNLTQLTSLSIPKYVAISMSAIYRCNNLTEMTYRGTSSEFITALHTYASPHGNSPYTDNEVITRFMSSAGALTTIHCADADIVKPSGSSSGNIQIVVNP